MGTVKKIFPVSVTKSPNGDPRTLRFVASTEDVDRDGDIIELAGWMLEEWYKNPVIMWAHDYSQPSIAKGVHAEKDIRNKKLIIDAKFPTLQELAPDGNPSEHAKFVETIFQLYNNNYLNAVSVGCNYKEAERRVDSDYGYRVKKAELLELSCCPIGANQNALRSASTIPGVGKEELDMVIKSFKPDGEKAAIPFKHYELADEGEKWDGPAVVAASEVEDLKKICTWYDSGKAEEDLTKGDFKLPHHLTKADDYKTVWAGVHAAAGALLGGRGGVDIPEADKEKCKKHLKSHYIEFDKPWPEDEKAWTEQDKALNPESYVQKNAEPDAQKEGRRLSAATLALIEELKSGLVELDEAITALSVCRGNMDTRIKNLESGMPDEPDDASGEDKSIHVIDEELIHIVE